MHAVVCGQWSVKSTERAGGARKAPNEPNCNRPLITYRQEVNVDTFELAIAKRSQFRGLGGETMNDGMATSAGGEQTNSAHHYRAARTGVERSEGNWKLVRTTSVLGDLSDAFHDLRRRCSLILDEVVRVGTPEAGHLLHEAPAIVALGCEDPGHELPLLCPALASQRVGLGRQPFDERDRSLGIDDGGSGEERIREVARRPRRSGEAGGREWGRAGLARWSDRKGARASRSRHRSRAGRLSSRSSSHRGPATPVWPEDFRHRWGSIRSMTSSSVAAVEAARLSIQVRFLFLSSDRGERGQGFIHELRRGGLVALAQGECHLAESISLACTGH